MPIIEETLIELEKIHGKWEDNEVNSSEDEISNDVASVDGNSSKQNTVEVSPEYIVDASENKCFLAMGHDIPINQFILLDIFVQKLQEKDDIPDSSKALS